MREAVDRTSAPPAAEAAAPAPSPEAATGHRIDVDSLLSPASFQTGPNPIRF
jgi:hypothetical protein